MKDSKPKWQSRTLWVAVIGMIGALLLVFGWDNAYKEWVALEAPVTAILTILFRWKATTTLK